MTIREAGQRPASGRSSGRGVFTLVVVDAALARSEKSSSPHEHSTNPSAHPHQNPGSAIPRWKWWDRTRCAPDRFSGGAHTQ
jgi:hypothetical protein